MCKCLYCYRELQPGMLDYHPACAKRIFGAATAPELPYRHNQIKDLAKQVIHSHTAVTGVQAKLSLDIEREQKSERFTIVGLWGRYILKPQTEQYAELPEIEDLTMHLAELAGIKVVPHTLVRFADGKLCYLTRRIDRTTDGEKLPMEDMCQLCGHQTEHKYHGSYERVSRTIRSLSSAPMLDVADFWIEVLFCWMVGNSDMHLKNFSLYAREAPRFTLTPAYDLLNTLIVMPEDTEELALSLNGKKRKITRADFEQAMTASGLNKKVQQNIFRRFETILTEWETCIRQSFMSVDMQDRYLALIHERWERLFT